MEFDGKAFGAEIVGAVKDHMDRTVTPILERLEALEKRVSEIPEPKEPPDLSGISLQLETLSASINDLPELPDISGMVAEAVEAIPKPQDGKSITVEDVQPIIDEGIQKAVENLPKPKDGEPGKDGRDGLDVKELFRAEGGKLMAVMSDGTTRDLGQFVGKDGEPGKDGKDGEPGKDGKDGFGFDNLDLAVEDTGVKLRFMRGEHAKEFLLPIVMDQGVYKAGNVYRKGNGVTWAGSFWIAQKDTDEKPGDGDSWRLAVKKGRDGRDGKSPPSAPPKVKA